MLEQENESPVPTNAKRKREIGNPNVSPPAKKPDVEIKGDERNDICLSSMLDKEKLGIDDDGLVQASPSTSRAKVHQVSVDNMIPQDIKYEKAADFQQIDDNDPTVKKKTLIQEERNETMNQEDQELEAQQQSCDGRMSMSGLMSESCTSSLFLDSCTSLPDDNRHFEDELMSSIKEDTSEEAVKYKKKKKSKRKKEKEAAIVGEEGAMIKKERPNYFVGFQVSNAKVHDAVIKIQEDIIAYEPMLYKALTDVATLHITLLVAYLEDDAAIQRAVSALEECKMRFEAENMARPLELTFAGVSHFSRQVVYSKLVVDEEYNRLIAMATTLREVFANAGVCMPDEKALNPHLTIAKTSKALHRRGKHFLRKIDPASYSVHEDTHFGQQVVNGMQLLAMNSKDEKRYYSCIKEILLEPAIDTADGSQDHSRCCFPRRPERLTIEKSPSKSIRVAVNSSPSAVNSSPPVSSKPSGSRSSFLPYVLTCAAAALVILVVARLRGRL